MDASLLMCRSVRAQWHHSPFILNSRTTDARLRTNGPDGVVTQEQQTNNLNFTKQRCKTQTPQHVRKRVTI